MELSAIWYVSAVIANVVVLIVALYIVVLFTALYLERRIALRERKGGKHD